MRYKKPLLIAFLIALFTFQQAQASNTMSSDKASISRVSLLQGYNQLEISVKYWHLDPNSGARIENPAIACIEYISTDFAYGCTETTTQYYPYPSNPMNVNLENDYLLNTVAKEMPAVAGISGEDYPNLPALSAQAVASRSFAYYFHSQGFLMWNTSGANEGVGNMQVTVPYAFEFALGNSFLNDPVDPCNKDYIDPNDDPNPNNLNNLQLLVCEAVTSTPNYYVAQGGSPINAEFGADMGSSTTTYQGIPPLPYLTGIQDPISATCDSHENSFDDAGMSQWGANRWALGNQCSTGGGAPWPVAWTDYRQILA